MINFFCYCSFLELFWPLFMSHWTLDGAAEKKLSTIETIVRANFALNHANANHFVPIYRIYRICFPRAILTAGKTLKLLGFLGNCENRPIPLCVSNFCTHYCGSLLCHNLGAPVSHRNTPRYGCTTYLCRKNFALKYNIKMFRHEQNIERIVNLDSDWLDALRRIGSTRLSISENLRNRTSQGVKQKGCVNLFKVHKVVKFLFCIPDSQKSLFLTPPLLLFLVEGLYDYDAQIWNMI